MCQSADCVSNPRNLGIAHEFRLHARAASSSDVSAFATMSTSAEVQHWKLFEEFCVLKHAAAGSEEVVNLLKDATLAVEPRLGVVQE